MAIGSATFYYGILLFYPLMIYFLTWWYHRLRRGVKRQLAWLPLVLMLCLTPIVSYITVISFSGAFGPGTLMICGAIPFAVVGFLVHHYAGRRSEKAKNDMPSLQWWIKLLLTIYIVVINLAPLLGFNFITGTCSNIHARQARPIIAALKAYQTDYGNYPSDLGELESSYIGYIPQPLCFHIFPITDYALGYTLEWCNSEKPILWLDVIQGGFPQRYNLEKDEWSSISFLDGVCSFLD